MPRDSFTDAKARVLAVLKAKAPQRVSTWDLIHLAQHSRAVGRVWELTQDGYRIEHTQEGRVHYWQYVGEPELQQTDLFGRSA